MQLSPSDQESLQDEALRAAGDHLQTTPITGGKKKDFAGAANAANLAAQAWLTDYIRRNHGGAPK